MGYNPFRWYTKGKKKRLPQSAHLFDKIQNGDFDYSHYYTEAEEARKEYSTLFQKTMDETGDYAMARTAAKMKNVRALKLDEEAFKDEQKILWSLKNELEEEFGFCLWDKMMKSKQMDLEELYDFYCKEKMRRKGLDV
jgi:anaerobic ribonucleoside-triphosphate reductase